MGTEVATERHFSALLALKEYGKEARKDGKLRAGFAVKYSFSAKISDSQFLPYYLLGFWVVRGPAFRQSMAII